MDRARDQDGANLVVSVDAFSVRKFDPATNTVVLSPDPWGQYTRPMYEALVSQAKSRGLQYMMSLDVTSHATPEAPIDAATLASWNARNSIPKTNSAFWDAFFAAWRPLVLERAAIARDLGVDYISLGQSMLFVSRTSASRWKSLIDDMRALGYKGKITYLSAANVENGFPEWKEFDPGLMGLFDMLGLRMNAVVGKSTPGEVLSPEQSRARMRSSLTTYLNALSSAPVPILILVAHPSVHGAVIHDEFIEPCITPTCVSLAPQRTRDYDQQADVYQAIAEVVNASPTGKGRVMGIITSQYWYFDEYFSGGGAAYDKINNIRGKPAEAVVARWFQRW